MKNAVFYHAGCPICVSAENQVVAMIDRSKYNVEVVHLGEKKARVEEAERKGVQSVPALVIGSDVLHINFGASLKDLK